jgi:hypothetical protein
MLKYVLVVVFNLPFVLLGILHTVQAHAHKRLPRWKFVTRLTFWLVVGVGLFFARPFYDYLASHNLTSSGPLSIFDVVETTGVTASLYLIYRLYAKTDAIEQHLAALHREVALRLSEVGPVSGEPDPAPPRPARTAVPCIPPSPPEESHP